MKKVCQGAPSPWSSEKRSLYTFYLQKPRTWIARKSEVLTAFSGNNRNPQLRIPVTMSAKVSIKMQWPAITSSAIILWMQISPPAGRLPSLPMQTPTIGSNLASYWSTTPATRREVVALSSVSRKEKQSRIDEYWTTSSSILA